MVAKERLHALAKYEPEAVIMYLPEAKLGRSFHNKQNKIITSFVTNKTKKGQKLAVEKNNSFF